MKRKKTVAVALTMALVFSSVWTGADPVSEAAGKLQISRSETTLYVGDSEQLAVLNTTKKQDKKIRWSSSKKAIVSVTKKGKIKGIKEGKASVTAKLSGKKLTCKVTVKKEKVTYVEATQTPADEGNQVYQGDVNNKMTTAEYWYSKIKQADVPLMDADEIAYQNGQNFSSQATNMVDLKNADLNYDGNARKANLSSALMSEVRGDRIGKRTTIYRAGTALDTTAMDAWFAEMKSNIDTAATTATDTKKYGLAVRRTDLFMAPTTDEVGWSATDPDSEFINSSINVNEPVLIDVVTGDGKYAHLTTDNCSGWAAMEDFAICDSKDDWLAQWDLLGRDDVLVVVGSHIELEESNLSPETSGLDLYIGTQLPLVPKEAIQGVAERFPMYDYSVYVPTRGADGKMVRKIAMIASHQKVSIGFPTMTQKNILTLAFNCLGDRYGWGGMLGSMDCSLYTRSIYRCFGLELPRNTTWQAAMPCYRVDLSAMTPDQKSAAIAKLEPGSLLMFSGHITMYIGQDQGKLYVISDMGSQAEGPTDNLVKKSIYVVSVNTLDLLRMNGKTWLEEMLWGITPFIGPVANS